jgi:alanine dehydrogenase
VTPRDVVRRLMELETTLIGYEIIRGPGGELPVLTPFSEMAGHMAVQVAAYLLQNDAGGRGILLGNVPGVPPPTVLIVGAGTAGQAAARLAVASGAHVIVLDEEVGKLRELSHALSGQVVTALASDTRLKQYTAIADVLIGAVLIPGARAPYLITESMIESMKPGSVVIDLSIDQGGCVETSRPTTIESPTYVAHDVVHYCVPNLTSNMARTASRALVNAAMPFVLELAARGVDDALDTVPGLAAGVYLYRGKMVHDITGQTLGIPAEPVAFGPERNSDG